MKNVENIYFKQTFYSLFYCIIIKYYIRNEKDIKFLILEGIYFLMSNFIKVRKRRFAF